MKKFLVALVVVIMCMSSVCYAEEVRTIEVPMLSSFVDTVRIADEEYKESGDRVILTVSAIFDLPSPDNVSVLNDVKEYPSYFGSNADGDVLILFTSSGDKACYISYKLGQTEGEYGVLSENGAMFVHEFMTERGLSYELNSTKDVNETMELLMMATGYK